MERLCLVSERQNLWGVRLFGECSRSFGHGRSHDQARRGGETPRTYSAYGLWRAPCGGSERYAHSAVPLARGRRR
eukprot:4837110-Prymnesium_polylepis.1